ncbi:MAG TPA: hypothetical protein VF665_15095 [Longimicrobium sp.]|jgi:hypothetical protein|uniref:hypothetical protein n=1 Tax=Longimicrobium sp. TaxID=2029185 RepID=UPI002EDABB5F
MSPRRIRLVALSFAVTVNVAAIVLWGEMTNWCFCSVTGVPEPPIPPPYALRFLIAATGPTGLLSDGVTQATIVINGIPFWFLIAWLSTHGLVFAARVRVRGGAGRVRFGLAPRDRVRLREVMAIACVLAAGAAGWGAHQRQAWLREADRVLVSTLAAAAAERELAGVRFTMYEWVGGDLVRVRPRGRYAVVVDPAEAGNHVPDRVIVPESYGGFLEFESGRRYRFSVYREHAAAGRGEPGWVVFVDSPGKRPRERW